MQQTRFAVKTCDSLGRITGASNALGSFTYGYSGVTPRLTLA